MIAPPPPSEHMSLFFHKASVAPNVGLGAG